MHYFKMGKYMIFFFFLKKKKDPSLGGCSVCKMGTALILPKDQRDVRLELFEPSGQAPSERSL